VFNLVVFSPSIKRYNLGGTYRIFALSFALTFACFGLLSCFNERSWWIKLPLLLLAWSASVAGDVPCAMLDLAASNRCAHEGQMVRSVPLGARLS
jgi:hypothetical protein